MKFKWFLLLAIVSINAKAQMQITSTTPQDIGNLIPGYSQVSTITTQTLSFAYTLPPADPTPLMAIP
jgi:hypothetical protein